MVLISVNELESIMDKALEKAEMKKLNLQNEKVQLETLFTINQVARRLNRAHRTIKKLISQGVLRSTPDGLISELAINDYLKNA